MKNKNIWDEETGLFNRYRFFQTSPNILVFSLLNSKRNSSAKIRYYFAKIFWKNFYGYSRKHQLRIVFHFILWPYYWAKSIKKYVGRKPYLYVKKHYHKSVSRQIIEQVYVAFFYSFSVKEYYMYELFEKENLRNVDKYLIRLTFKPLIYYFLDEVYKKENGLKAIYNQDSKSHFDQVSKKHDLSAVPVLAHINNKKVEYIYDKKYILGNTGDLFIKPEESRGGNGAELWVKKGDKYENSKMEVCSFDELIAIYMNKNKSYFSSSDYIIQPRIRNHKKIDFGTKALSTVRINTLLINGKINVLFAVLRFSSNNTSVVDNFHAGGMAAPIINLETGELGSASQMDIKKPGNRMKIHPLMNKKVEGLNLPYWHEAKEIVINAHQVGFKERMLIGWDVALTVDGPMLVESNGWADTEITQIAYNKPLANFKEFELFAQELEDNYREFYG